MHMLPAITQRVLANHMTHNLAHQPRRVPALPRSRASYQHPAAQGGQGAHAERERGLCLEEKNKGEDPE